MASNWSRQSNVILRVGCDPLPVTAGNAATHWFEAQNLNGWSVDVLDALVWISAGPAAGVAWRLPGGGTADVHDYGRLGVLPGGNRASQPVSTDLAKQPGTLSQGEQAGATISFTLVATPGRRTPPTPVNLSCDLYIPIA